MDRSKIILYSITGVTVVVVLVFGFLGFQARSSAHAAMEERDQAVHAIEKIYRLEKPFPSKENVAKIRACNARMEVVRSQLTNLLAARNVPAPKLTPSVFVQSLRKLATAKFEEAPIIDGKKVVSADFTFGFDRYIGANPTMPREKDVPRLLQQLYVIEALVDGLYKAQVSRIDSISREQFDSDAAATEANEESSRRGIRGRHFNRSADAATKNDGNRAYQHFSVTFAAKQGAALDFINALTRSKYFVLVTDVSFVKSATDIRVPGVSDAKEKGASDRSRRSSRRRHSKRSEASKSADASVVTISKLPPGQRLMSGPEIDPPITVTIEFDVYGFAKGGK